MIRLVLNDAHLHEVIERAVGEAKHRLFISTADLKDVHLPRGGGRRARSIVDVFGDLTARGVEVRVLHAGVPSGAFLAELKSGVPDGLTLRRCPRVHAKAVITDARAMYLGSANLTGAGLGAKSPRRRNFEVGVWTDDVALIDPVLDMLDEIWTGQHCADCGRREHCPVPLEEPDL